MLNKNNHLDFHIEEGNNDRFNIANILEYKLLDSGVFLVHHNKLNRYMNAIRERSTFIILTDEEYSKYKYRPRIMSFDLYKTPELWFLLMKLNDILEISQFDKRKLYIFNAQSLDFLNRIYLNENEEEYGYI